MIFPPEPSKECVKVSHVIFECRVINHHPISKHDISIGRKAEFCTLFYNIDGSKSKFDEFATELTATSVTFSVTGITTTNVSKTEFALLHKLDINLLSNS